MVLLGSTWVYLGQLGPTWVYLGLLGSTWVYFGLLGATRNNTLMVKYSFAPPVAKVLRECHIRSSTATKQNEEENTVLSSEKVYAEHSNSLVQNTLKIYTLTLDIF